MAPPAARRISLAMLNRMAHHLRFWRAFAKLTRDPAALEAVFDMNTAACGLAEPKERREIVRLFGATELGARALETRPRLGRVDFTALRRDEGTLGDAYARFLEARGLSPEDIPTLDPENRGDAFEFITAHMFETHDVWHVVTGFETDLAGELGLQAFYLAQYPSPLSAMILGSGVLGATLRLGQRSLRSVDSTEQLVAELSAIIAQISDGWSRGRRASGMMGRDWKRDFGRDLTDVRAELGVAA
jgi:ubiquinone biosynthesis protein Coq4